MSSETRKKACSSSVSQPRVAVARNCSGLRVPFGARRAAVSITEMPRLHLPPRVLWLRDCEMGIVNWKPCEGMGIGDQAGRTFSNQSRAFLGIWVDRACLERSSTSEGQTDSNSLIVVGILGGEKTRRS